MPKSIAKLRSLRKLFGGCRGDSILMRRANLRIRQMIASIGASSPEDCDLFVQRDKCAILASSIAQSTVSLFHPKSDPNSAGPGMGRFGIRNASIGFHSQLERMVPNCEWTSLEADPVRRPQASTHRLCLFLKHPQPSAPCVVFSAAH